MFLFRNKKKKPDPAAVNSQRGEQEKAPVSVEVPVAGFVLDGCVCSHMGCVRDNNEDNYLLGGQLNGSSENESSCQWHGRGPQVFGVFDGMGGEQCGEQASRIAAEAVAEAARALPVDADAEAVREYMRAAFLEANRRVVALQQQVGAAGTTGTVGWTDGSVLTLYHLGDSRAYLLREDDFFLLTKDQTLAQMKLDVGLVAPDDPALEADKHKLTEYIGRDLTGQHIRPAESEAVTLQSGDRLLLCSDGLYDMCTDYEIGSLLMEGETARVAAASLVQAAVDHGGKDNVTCVVVFFT